MRLQRHQRRRALILLGGFGLLVLVVAFALTQLRNALVFFRTPSELALQLVPPAERVRVGGMVATWHAVGTRHRFEVTDFAHSISVEYEGLLPDLFRVGQGVVAEGHLQTNGVFLADMVLARHDETYMPPEAAEALSRARQARIGRSTQRDERAQ